MRYYVGGQHLGSLSDRNQSATMLLEAVGAIQVTTRLGVISQLTVVFRKCGRLHYFVLIVA